ncbi:MAG: hypothetical protein VYA84_04380 [Planctomycetota bacterium]|nr:hypothetical protein [Planctomycetota bacterium]
MRAAGGMGVVLITWLIYQSLKSDAVNQLSVDSGNVTVLAEAEQFLPVVLLSYLQKWDLGLPYLTKAADLR